MPPPSLADRAMPSASFNDFIFAQTLNPPFPGHHYYHQIGSPSSLFLLIENFAAPTFLSYVVIARTFGRSFWNGGKKIELIGDGIRIRRDIGETQEVTVEHMESGSLHILYLVRVVEGKGLVLTL